MKVLLAVGVVLLALAAAAFAIAQVYAGVTVVPWADGWRVERVTMLRAVVAIFGASALGIFLAGAVVHVHRRVS